MDFFKTSCFCSHSGDFNLLLINGKKPGRQINENDTAEKNQPFAANRKQPEKNNLYFLQREVMQCVDSVLPLKYNCNKESLIVLV